MSSTLGDKIKISVFGESHGNGIGVVIDGLPAGEAIDMEAVLLQMSRRAPGRDKTATPRKESDLPKILSGILGSTLTGAPLCAVIENTNTRSGDYGNLLSQPRPGHSDYTAFVKYNAANDIRGGGHFSGRLTAPLVFAGAVCRQLLEKRGIKIAAHIESIGSVRDSRFDPVGIDTELIERLNRSSFALIDEGVEQAMRDEVEAARLDRDSVGGTIECIVTGFPKGHGTPLFDGIDSRLASLLFAVPAVRGVAFGSGFLSAQMTGSAHNDPYVLQNGSVRTETNRHGGIIGGISTGMPIVFLVAVKPAASIGKPQKTLCLSTGRQAVLTIEGRHDACIAVRAVPVIEAVAALALYDLYLEETLC